MTNFQGQKHLTTLDYNSLPGIVGLQKSLYGDAPDVFNGSFSGAAGKSVKSTKKSKKLKSLNYKESSPPKIEEPIALHDYYSDHTA